ncbi:tripartite tricarboxylate transporter substrate binding protein [Variovorax saccharolyticus]|uniref:tripartite tricarboxylate transporter substrate binding protein n=1 Tax=Variovorax saccharolyticus TaxID=3053516 RepID=UPI002577A49B|nr:tripartite tricarboxylate transporter substrate binding protein [Variovorax sp. J31P216]MDM0025511.1 tripartite tricarboxylate transporter substrate binding protein [Variovorax sp. J31P216]
MLLGGLAALATPFARAQGSADTPVRLVVPFTPGTGIDLIARQIAPALSERLKRPFFVENRPGASGNIGTQEVVRATPDGSTLLVSVNTLVMNMALYPRLGFNPVSDLAPVSQTSWGQLLLVANPGTKIDSLQGLIARAKAKPGALNYGSPGAGTPHHLAMELLKNRAAVSLTHISYRGTAPAVTDLLGGQIDVMFLPIHVALQHVKAGKLTALAISSDKPSPLLPEVPPLSILKLGNMNVDMWYGVLAPAGTPRPYIERLNKELREILAQPAIAKAFETQGMTPAHSTPEAFQQMLAADAKRWADLIKAQGITAE